jgi:penicillin-binding protein 1C
MEWRLPKDDILEAYLNSAPYGMNLVGCEAAARRYFGKPALELTLPEAALLAGLPKAPSRLMPLEHPDLARERRDYVLDRMRQAGFITATQARRARRQHLKAQWRDFPSAAKHLAMRAEAEVRRRGRLTTTLDREIQQRTEDYLLWAVRGYSDEITNAAAMVVDVREAAVLARVGSVDFFDAPGGGQVDVTASPRSPGSALKPFVYGLALEQGRLYPGEMLCDGSVDYGLYRPENYDGLHRGAIPASYALRRSLNVPAVQLVERLGPLRMYVFLEACGLSTLNQEAEDYGLGIALGNCEVRMDELAQAYAALANLGELRPLRWREQPRPARSSAPSRRILREDICKALYAMMEQPLPEEFHAEAAPKNAPPRICWKTGTSNGHRDAWAFVFNRQYLVAVWLGNNDASPSKWLVGAQAALPLAGRIFRALPADAAPSWPSYARDMREARVCSTTGLPASVYCPHTGAALFPRSMYLNRRCDVHYPSSEGGVRARWPARASRWDLARVGAPEARPAEAKLALGEGVAITSPADGAQFVLTGEKEGDVIQLESTADAAAEVHWYLNGRHVGASEGKRLSQLQLFPGEHTLACMAIGAEGAAHTAQIRFSVIEPARLAHFR